MAVTARPTGGEPPPRPHTPTPPGRGLHRATGARSSSPQAQVPAITTQDAVRRVRAGRFRPRSGHPVALRRPPPRPARRTAPPVTPRFRRSPGRSRARRTRLRPIRSH